MRRLSIALLCLCLAVLAAAPASAGFDAEAFKKNFVAGLAGRPNAPALTPENVEIEASEKAVDFAGTEIYAVKGRLAPSAAQAQPFMLYVSADGRYYVSNIVDMATGKSLLKDAGDRLRARDVKDLGHVILTGKGKARVLFISDPFCPFCRQAYAYLAGRGDAFAELKLAHFPLTSHPGADIACGIMAWAADHDAKHLAEYVRFAYTELPPPHVEDRSLENLKQAWEAVAAAYLKRFPKLKALGADADALVAGLSASVYVGRVQDDLAKASNLGVTGTPVIYVGDQLVEGFDKELLDKLLKP